MFLVDTVAPMNKTSDPPVGDESDKNPINDPDSIIADPQIVPAMPPPPDPSIGQYYGNQNLYVKSLPDEPSAMLAMIFGILGLVVCGVLSPVGLVIGAKSRKRIKESNGAYGGEGMATAGFVCGIIGTVFLALGLLYVVFVVILFGSLAIGGL